MSQQKKTKIMYRDFFWRRITLWLLTVTTKNISNKKVQNTKNVL